MSAMVPDRQPAPVKVQLNWPYGNGANGTPWPVTGVYAKTIALSAAGVWSGIVEVQGSADMVSWVVLGTLGPSTPVATFEAETGFIRLHNASQITDSPVAWLTGLSYWGEV